MNKEDFDAALAALQAQLDAAERAFAGASASAQAAWAVKKDARRALIGRITYGKHRGWIERAKRAKREEPAVADAAD